VARIKSGSASTISITQGITPLFYPSFQSGYGLWTGYAYAGVTSSGTTSWVRSITFARTKSNLAPISTNTFKVYSDQYGSTRYNYGTNILISMNTNGNTLYNNVGTGSCIQITFNSTILTAGSSCQVWVQNEMSVFLTCIVSTGMITIYSQYADYTTSNNIFVSLGVMNPSTASVTFAMNMYSYYYNSSRFNLVISTTTTYGTDLTYQSNNQLEKSRLSIFPFRSKLSMASNSPLRVQFNLPDSPGTISNGIYLGYTTGLLQFTNIQFTYSSAYICYIKEYTSFSNMNQ
jgi:hypothetical protein